MPGRVEEKKRKMVMVAIDESESSYYALVWVLKNLKEAKSELFLFSALPLSNCSHAIAPSLGAARLYFHGPADLQYSAQEQRKQVSLGLLKKAKTICSAHGTNAKTITEAGVDPKVAICSAVKDHNIDLLIVGSEDYGALKRVFMGGTLSDYCLNNAKCPVLVVKKPKDTQTI